MPKSPTSHRDLLLDSAQQLILLKGFAATRVDEVCEAAGVTKGSFYHHFQSKDDLASALIDHYFDHLTEALCSGGWQAEEDPVKRLMRFMDNAQKVVRGPLLREGCLLGSFALDLSATHPEIRKEVEDRFDVLVEVFEPVLKGALKSSQGSSKVSAAVFARQFVSVLQGSIVMAKAYDDFGKVAEGIRCYRSMLEAVLSA